MRHNHAATDTDPSDEGSGWTFPADPLQAVCEQLNFEHSLVEEGSVLHRRALQAFARLVHTRRGMVSLLEGSAAWRTGEARRRLDAATHRATSNLARGEALYATLAAARIGEPRPRSPHSHAS